MRTTETPDLATSHIADPLVSIEEAAEHLAITKATLYTWRSRRPGFGPRAVKVGGCLRYRLSELNEWIAAHTEDASTDDITYESNRGRSPHPAGGVALTPGGRRL